MNIRIFLPRNIALFLRSSCTASPVSGRLLLRSLGTIGFRDVTRTNDRDQSGRPSNYEYRK